MDDKLSIQTFVSSFFRQFNLRRRHLLKPAIKLALTLSLTAGQASAIDLNIQTEAEYTAMIDAIRAAEYTRQQYLEANANPRALATITGLWAFAERNPLATPEQLSEFASDYDAALSTTIDGDPTLIRFGSVATALNSTRIGTEGVLAGMDTRVGQRAMELLGVALPGLQGYEESRQRMARFDLAAVRALINRSETADALTSVLAGVDPSGNRMAGLAESGAAYLESVGFTPMLGLIDPLQSYVNPGLYGLPSYAEFVIIRDVDGGHLALEQEVFDTIHTLQNNARQFLNAIGVVDAAPNLALDSIDLYRAATNTNDPDHTAALVQLEQRRQSILNGIRYSSDERAAVFARTLLLQQSNYPQVQQIATVTRSFAGLQLQVNNDLVVAEHSVGLLGSIAGLGAAYATGDVWGGVQSMTELASGALGIAGALDDSIPSSEEQIFNQIVELRQQVEDLRVQMNERFDVVDEKLDSIFGTMITGFRALGEQVGELQDDVNDLSVAIAQTRTALERIEAALFGFAGDLLLLPLSIETDLVLNYRSSGQDLSYGNDSPNFVTSSSFFHTYATSISKSTTFAGPTSQQLTLDNAQAILSSGDPIARSINDLRRIPTGLFTNDGTPVTGPITSSRVAAPAPWSQAASAYAQFARENPWYFAYLLSNQLSDPGGASDLDQVIDDGQRISNLADATRGRQDLWEGLVGRALEDSYAIENAVVSAMDNELILRGLSNSSTSVNPWGPPNQPVSSLITQPVQTVRLGEGAYTTVSQYTSSMPYKGFELSISDHRTNGGPQDRNELAQHTVMSKLLRPPQVHEYRFSPDETSDPSVMRLYVNDQWAFYSVRELKFRIQYNFGEWIDWPTFDGAGFLNDRIREAGIARVVNDLGNSGDIRGTVYSSGTALVLVPGIPFPISVAVRIVAVQDVSYMQSDYVYTATEGLAELRSDLRGVILDKLASPGSNIGQVGQRLDNTSALFDGYLTLGVADGLTRSEILRSAFRSVPGIGGLGFRSADVAAMITYADLADDIDNGAEPAEYDVRDISLFLEERLFAIEDELATILMSDAPSFPYVEFVLADLRELRDDAFRLAIDDTYIVDGAVSINAAEGLIANDIGQPGRIDGQELMVDLEFFTTPEFMPPTNGMVSVSADGSFIYTPDQGFEGTDSFNYSLVARVDDSQNPVGDPNARSEPAMVVLRVSASSCLADFTNDGILNFFDVSAFLQGFGAQDPLADFTGDGVWNFFDVSAFLQAFGAGCP